MSRGEARARAERGGQQIQQLKDRQYEAEARTWDEMKKHVYQVADAKPTPWRSSSPRSLLEFSPSQLRGE